MIQDLHNGAHFHYIHSVLLLLLKANGHGQRGGLLIEDLTTYDTI